MNSRLLAACAVCASVAAGADWQTGKILDVKSTIQHFAPAGGSLLGTLAASGENKSRDTETLVDGPRDRYTLHDGREHPCRFIVGDEVSYKQQKAFLVLRDADGRKCRLQIVQQERKK
jgi:hypothetical protein